ncbi:MAG: ABC transporter permease [Acidobacteriota bacterium]
MLGFDAWREIFDALRAHPLRTTLTGFSVAWGIFILVVLLGFGQALENGVVYQFRDDAVNSIWISPGQTSLPHAGLRPGREVQMTLADHQEFAERVEGVDRITSRLRVRSVEVRADGKSEFYAMRGVHPGHAALENTIIVEGRYLHPTDLERVRKVVVIGRRVSEALFEDSSALGEWVFLNDIAFRVVGIFTDEGSEGEEEIIYVPITTAQRVFAGGSDRIDQLMFTTGTLPLETTELMAEGSRERLAARHRFAVEDERAVFVNNLNERFEQMRQLTGGIRMFVWLIGIGTLAAGVVGVSNIMMIAVRERTREIGVRKALGATPLSVVALVLTESVVITAVAGYLGLVLGVVLLEVGRRMPMTEYFRQPEVDLGVALSALALLIVSGTLAGLLPARRAAAISPIEALRDE